MAVSEWKVEFSARRIVILAEAETARAVILARHDSAEAARVDLDDLDAYTAGRISAARGIAMRRLSDDNAPSSDPRMNAFRQELEARRSAIFSEQRRAVRAIYARHDSYEAARPEVFAMFEYNRGRLDAARDHIGRKYGMPARRSLTEPYTE